MNESLFENRKKVNIILKTIKDFSNKKIDIGQFQLQMSKHLSRLFNINIPVHVIGEKYPQIFINCHIKGLKFVVDGIYVSTSLFSEFTPEELVAAFLHEAGHYYRTKKDPSLVRKFFLSRGIGYARLLLSMLATGAGILSTKQGSKLKKFLTYLIVVLSVFAVISMFVTSYYYYKVGQEEYIADSVATKFGYGKELITFMQRYKELEDLYGYPPLTKMSREFSEVMRKAIQALKLHPDDTSRMCQIMYEIIQTTDRNVKYDSDLYKWAKEQYNLTCKKHVPIDDNKLDKIEILVNSLRKKFLRK